MDSKFEKYCPSGTPITIPYMEIYRTDELNYVDYVSPLNSLSGTSVTSYSSETDGTSESSSSTTSSSSSSGSSKYQNDGNTPKLKTKTVNKNNQQLYTKLSTAVQKYFKSGVNVNTLVNRYRNCGKNLDCVTKVTKKSKTWLKKGNNVTVVSYAIYIVIQNHYK